MSALVAKLADPGAVSALAASIQAEQLAAYGYGALGPHLSAPDAITLARDCELAHQQLVDSAMTLIAGGSGPTAPTNAPGSYQLPTRPVDEASAQKLATQLEETCASAWRYTLAQLAQTTTSTPSAGATSMWLTVAAALTDSAVRAVRWRKLADPSSASVPFPGV